MSRAVVIGAGIAGLAAAALLARDGHAVTVLEKNGRVGGRAGLWEHEGFRFDTGPSWYLMPDVFDHFFRLLGTTASAQLTLRRLEPGYRVFFQDQPAPVDVVSGRERACALFESIEPGAGARLDRYLDSAADTYRIALDTFLYTTYARRRPLLTRDVLHRLPRLAHLLSTPLSTLSARSFSDPRLRKILGYPAVFLGSSPDRTPALYHLMSHLDLDDGVWYPGGGFTRLIDAVAHLAADHGADIRTRTTVTAIRTEPRGRRRRVTGVDALDPDGNTLAVPADVVVSAADLHHTETRLLPENLATYPEQWWTRRTPGPGAVLALLGVDGPLPQLAHHTLFFTDDWQENFDAIFTRPARIPRPASVYACRASATDPAAAPAGRENLFLLIPVPADPQIGHGGTDLHGDPAVEDAADAAIDQIARWARIPDLARRILVRRTVGPADFADDLNAWRGGALGPGHTLRQSAFLRGRNASAKVDGLLYAGGSTIPGIGLPMCLVSAELAVKRLRGDTTTTPLEEPL